CHGWMTSLVPLYVKTAYKKEPVFAYSKVVYTAQNDQFEGNLGEHFIRKATISTEIKDKDMEPFKEGTNLAMTLGGSKYADVVIHGDATPEKGLADEIKPSRYKKVVKYEESWKEDVGPLLDLYKSLTES